MNSTEELKDGDYRSGEDMPALGLRRSKRQVSFQAVFSVIVMDTEINLTCSLLKGRGLIISSVRARVCAWVCACVRLLALSEGYFDSETLSEPSLSPPGEERPAHSPD